MVIVKQTPGIFEQHICVGVRKTLNAGTARTTGTSEEINPILQCACAEIYHAHVEKWQLCVALIYCVMH